MAGLVPANIPTCAFDRVLPICERKVGECSGQHCQHARAEHASLRCAAATLPNRFMITFECYGHQETGELANERVRWITSWIAVAASSISSRVFPRPTVIRRLARASSSVNPAANST